MLGDGRIVEQGTFDELVARGGLFAELHDTQFGGEETNAMPPRREPLLLLHIVGQYPLAGVAWQAIHYLVGLPALGWDVFYVEDSGAPPYDPSAGGVTGEVPTTPCATWPTSCGASASPTAGPTSTCCENETHGLSRARLDELYRGAAAS